MYTYKIDKNGFIIDNYLIGSKVTIPVGCITTQLPQPLLFHRPRWNGTKWIEGATQEVIDELTKIESLPPTQEERIKELESIVNLLLMGGI